MVKITFKCTYVGQLFLKIRTLSHLYVIEFAAMVKKSKKQKLAQTFIDFMLSEDFQKAIPTSNWMYPVITYD